MKTNNSHTSFYTYIKTKLLNVKSTMSSWYKSVFPQDSDISKINKELTNKYQTSALNQQMVQIQLEKTKVELEAIRIQVEENTIELEAKNTLIEKLVTFRNEDKNIIEDYFDQLGKSKALNAKIRNKYNKTLEEANEKLASLRKEKEILVNEITKANQSNKPSPIVNDNVNDMTLGILKEREIELAEANNNVKELKEELDMLKAKDQSNIINLYAQKEENLVNKNMQLTQALKEIKNAHKEESAHWDEEMDNLNKEKTELITLNTKLINIPTDPIYLTNKASMEVVLKKLEIMYTSLRSIQEYSINYTTEIVKSIDKYKSTTLELMTVESQYKETNLLMEHTRVQDNTHHSILTLQLSLQKLAEKREACIKTLKSYELENDKKYNFKNLKESEQMVTFLEECDTFENYITEANKILNAAETYDKLAYEKQFKTLQSMQDKINTDKLNLDKECTSLRNIKKKDDNTIKELKATIQSNQEIQQTEEAKLKGELHLKENLYKNELNNFTQAKDKMLDEQESLAKKNIKTTQDLMVEFRSMQDNLKDQQSLRKQLFNLQKENEFILSEYSKASLLIQTLANNYATDSHIVAYKAKVNNEMLRIEKQMKTVSKDDPNHSEMEKYLGILKRSNTYTSGVLSSALNRYTKPYSSDNESNRNIRATHFEDTRKVYLGSNKATSFIVREKNVVSPEPVTVNRLSHTVQDSTNTINTTYQPNNNNNNNHDQVYFGDN